MVDELQTDSMMPGGAAVNRQAILEHLNAEAPGLGRKYGFRSLPIFGSMPRGDDHGGGGASLDPAITISL